MNFFIEKISRRSAAKEAARTSAANQTMPTRFDTAYTECVRRGRTNEISTDTT